MAGIRALVAVDSSADREVVQEALPASAQIEIVGVIYGLDESWNALRRRPRISSSSRAAATPTGPSSSSAAW